MSKQLIANAVRSLVAKHGRRITATGFLTRGDGTGTLVADQNQRLAFYWQPTADGAPKVGVATLHPQSSIIFKNSVDYESTPIDLGKVQDDDTFYILGENSFGVSGGGGTTIIEREIVQAGQSVSLPLMVRADQSQPSLNVIIGQWTAVINRTLYIFGPFTQDMTANVPGAGLMCYAVLFLQNDYATIEVQTSTPRSTVGLPLGIADIQTAITAATSTDIPIFAVKLVNGQTTITQNDLNNDGVPLQQYVSAESTNGTATLVAGTVTVSLATITTSSLIFITAQETGTLTGVLRVSARVAGTSFTISSSINTDTAKVAWQVVN